MLYKMMAVVQRKGVCGWAHAEAFPLRNQPCEFIGTWGEGRGREGRGQDQGRRQKRTEKEESEKEETEAGRRYIEKERRR